MLSPANDVVRFGPFELDQSVWQLRKKGIRIRTPQQPLQLLALLLERPGVVVTREELQRRLWTSEIFVDFEHGLNKNIQKLREALGDSADSPAYIETIPRIGYRFIGTLTDPPPSSVKEPEARASEVVVVVTPEPMSRQPIWRRRVPWAILAACAAGLFFAVWWVHRRTQTAPIRSLAVLPLENLSGDPNQEYFAEGMTDELITELARIPNLRVVSRTSVMQDKGSRKPLREIARELDVDALVEGSVVRSGDRVRITAQLIDARDDKHLWAQSFEEKFTDILLLQDSVAREIASQTKVALLPPQTRPAMRIDPQAQDAYLRGLYFLHRRDAIKCTQYFQQAISIEPLYAAAYAGLAEGLVMQAIGGVAPAGNLTEARAAAKRSIELDPASGEAYSAIGDIETLYEHDWAAAERDQLRGIALNPNNPIAELGYANYLAAMNRPEEAVSHARRALKLDPLSFITNRHLGSVLYFARHYDEALHYLQLAVEMQPDLAGLAEHWMSFVYEQKGMLSEAVEADLYYRNKPDADSLRATFRRGGWTAFQKARIDVLIPHSSEQCFPYDLALSYLRLGDHDRAISWLNRAVDQHCFWTVFSKVNPGMDDLRTDQRYHDLLKRLNLPD